MNIYLGIPQMLYTSLLLLSLGIQLAKNGEPREGEYKFGLALIAVSIQIAILIWGGFYSIG